MNTYKSKLTLQLCKCRKTCEPHGTFLKSYLYSTDKAIVFNGKITWVFYGHQNYIHTHLK